MQQRSSTAGPGPTDPRPTARSNAATAPCSRNGPTPASTAQKPNEQPPTTPGSTPTITTAATPHSPASHQPTSCPTCVDRTPRVRTMDPKTLEDAGLLYDVTGP